MCADVRACVRPNLSGSYIYAWISKLFDTVVVLECHLKRFLGRLMVKITLEGHIN